MPNFSLIIREGREEKKGRNRKGGGREKPERVGNERTGIEEGREGRQK